MKKEIYHLIGFKENFHGSGRLLLNLQHTRNNSMICCFLEDIKFICEYIKESDLKYINYLNKRRS